MARILIILVAALIATAIQGVLLYAGLPRYALPQLVTLLVVFLSFSEVSILGAFVAFSLGLLIDFSSEVLIGPWAGALVAVYGCLAVLSQRLFIDSAIVAAVTAFIAVVLADGFYMILAYEYRSLDWEYPVQALGQALATAIIAPFVLHYLSRRLRRRGPLAGRPGTLAVS